MSKSYKRVMAALDAADVQTEVLEMAGETGTAQQAADQAGCALDQIAKSVILRAEEETCFLFLTAGGNRVDLDKASAVAGRPLSQADAALIRKTTGFAIGGVSPVGHLTPIKAFVDPRLSELDVIFAAAGTPRHIFPIRPSKLIAMIEGALEDFVI